MFKNKKLLFSLMILMLSTSSVFAKKFANGYTEFELPPGWDCGIEGSEWVCQSSNKDRKKEAIIILAAKKRGPQDKLENYQAYLRKTKGYQLPGSKMQKSEPKYTKVKTINQQAWVDALHLASEVPGFYTRYLATVKADIGVAITFSVTKNLYTAYQGLFDNVIASMRVFRQSNKNLANLKKSNNAGENFDDATFAPEDDTFDIAQSKRKKRGSSSEGGNELFIIIGLAVAGLLILKKLKGKKAPVKKKKKKSTKK